MPNVTLYYNNGSGYTSQLFTAAAIKGLDTPDTVLLYNRQHEHLDGSFVSNVLGFKRRIFIDFGVLQTAAGKKFLLNFIKANDTYIKTGTQTATVVPDEAELEAEWLEGCENGSRFMLDLTETRLHRSFPTVGLGDDLIYFTLKVKIEGTQASPETFTTGTGKLATTARGIAYPTFNAATQSVSVLVNSTPYQDRKVNVVTQGTISGGNVTFTCALSDAGNDSGDGFSYCDISILVMED